MAATINPAHQAFILARISEFCQYHAKLRHYDSDPWAFMREKLLQLEPSLAALKQELLAATRRQLLADLKQGPLEEEAYSDFKALLERLLSRGDFADVAIHLSASAPAGNAEWVEKLLAQARADHVFLEERKPPQERSPHSDRLIGELYRRLELDGLGKIIERGKRTRRRRAVVLRRMRRNVAEYCTVVRIPIDPRDTFTPFMLPRVEALIGACLRFLNKYR